MPEWVFNNGALILDKDLDGGMAGWEHPGADDGGGEVYLGGLAGNGG